MNVEPVQWFKFTNIHKWFHKDSLNLNKGNNSNFEKCIFGQTLRYNKTDERETSFNEKLMYEV